MRGSTGRSRHCAFAFVTVDAKNGSVSDGNADGDRSTAKRYHAAAAGLAGEATLSNAGSNATIWAIRLMRRSSPSIGSHFAPKQIRPDA